MPAKEVEYCHGETVITALLWQQICAAARCIGGEVQKVIDEIDVWARDCFITEPVFTILGI